MCMTLFNSLDFICLLLDIKNKIMLRIHCILFYLNRKHMIMRCLVDNFIEMKRMEKVSTLSLIHIGLEVYLENRKLRHI